jgi:hypothetical protein
MQGKIIENLNENREIGNWWSGKVCIKLYKVDDVK